MAEFKLGRIRFVWKGEWAASTTYYIDDVVRYGGKTFICAVGHTSDSDFYTDLNFAPTKWNQMSDGQRWRDEWSVSTGYVINDIVRYGGSLYICNTPHTSNSASEKGSPGLENATGLEADQAKWNLYAEGFDWKGDWSVSTRYLVGDLVRYGPTTYRCKTAHTSVATTSQGLEIDLGSNYWEIFSTGLDYKGDWQITTRYKVNDVVKRGAGLWVVKAGQQHTSSSDFATDNAAGYWDQLVEGFEFENAWNIATAYQNGDIVSYGGNQYISKTTHTGTVPTASGNTDWDLFSENFTFSNDWDIATSYKIGEVVRLNGYTYRAKQDSPSIDVTVTATSNADNGFTTTDTTGMVANMAVRFTGTTFGNVFTGATYYIKSIVDSTTFTISTVPGGTEFVPTTASGSMSATAGALPGNTTYWDKLNNGLNWTGQWTDDTEYFLGDLVRYGANNYICIQNHRAEADDGSTIGAEGGGADNSRPDQDLAGLYWNAFTIGSDLDVLTTTGDLVYYSGSGPARLPIGTEGQVLVSTGTIPEWRSLGKTDQVYYVAPHGVDSPAPIYGASLDRPWKTIRYACEQVEKGPRNPNAQYLLERNRVFLQREVTSWIEAQVAAGTGIWSGFDYDEYKCERDVGFIIDRLIWDLGHGGNLKMRAAALSLVGGLGAEAEFSAASEVQVYGGAGLAAEKEQSVAAYGYLETIIGNVLANTAPSVAYQDASDSTATADQYVNTEYTTEAGVTTTVSSLLKIVTDTITAGDTSAIPERIVPNVTINVKSGRYREVLPIIVPAETVILGDEVRSTNVRAAAASDRNVDISDSYYTVDTFGHLSSIIGNIVSGSAVTPTSGNTESQDQSWPVADDADTATITSKLVDVMKEQVDFRLGTKHTVNLTDPVGYNSSYLVGYGTARKNITENKKFFQEEIIQYITDNYPNLKYSRTKCRQDVGYLVDALSYDLTYGGTYQTLNAAKAYWDGNGSVRALSESTVTQTIAAYQYLQTILKAASRNSTISALQTDIPQYKNADAGAGAETFINDTFQIVLNTLAGDSTGSDIPTVTVSTISSNVVTTTSNHGLQVGDAIIPLETSNNFVADTKYWIISTPAADTFTVAATFGGSTFGLQNGSGLSIPAFKEDYPEATNAVSSTTALITAAETLDAQQENLVTLVDNYLDANYPNLTYDSVKCQRDTRLILEAVMFDFMLGNAAANADATNFATHIAALSYLRSTASDVFNLGQKAATRAAYQYLAEVIAGDTATYLNSDATAAARVALLMDKLDTIFFSATNEGEVCQTELRVRDYARLKLEENRAFIKAEITAYIDATYADTATDTTVTTDVITISDTSWLKRNTAIKFTGSTFGNIVAGTTYYVKDVVDSTTFTIGTTRYATAAVTLTTASGSMGVELVYNEELCARDVDTYIDALKWDLQWTSNYRSRYVARYYANAVLGSQEEDFYYLRNGTGIRNQTLDGLNGDLLPENQYGTSRVSAGAYCSLDPGWGPDDFRTWIISRSPYVQNNATFGNAAIGQKIDGALHNGGNDSIVSNDFTQVISDGIGAWVANNGRAELVSVFTYYSHIGYLSTEGGRIRGTNGNNSYGDFGSVAEGFDSTEVEGTAIVDNKLQFEATAGSVPTDQADQIYVLEFDNAGSEYTETDWGLFGAGSNAVAKQEGEFRDDAVFNVRLPDNVDDSTTAPEAEGNFGGFGYITSSNTAQGGTTTQITIAATDSQNSSAYVGMRVFLDGGTGVGQIGIIATYNSGTKIATVTKPSTGAAGWDHIIPGTTIASPDASTTYTIEPRVEFSAAPHSATAVTMATSSVWQDLAYQPIFENYLNTAQSSTSGTGTGATFDVFKKGTKYAIKLNSGGLGYSRLDTITILGSTIGGDDSTHDINITITSVNSTNGAIQAFDHSGKSTGGNFIALVGGTSDATNISANGSTWSSGGTLPVSTTWTALAGGRMDKVVGAGNFVTGRAYTITEPGDTPWLTVGSDSIITGSIFEATGAGTFSSIQGFARENDARIVAIAGGGGVDDTAFTSDGGATWTAGGNLPSTGSWNALGYGGNVWMAVKSGSDEAAISQDGGVTWSATAANLPSSSTWDSVAYGAGIWVVLASGTNNSAWSDDDGTTWNAVTLPSTSNWSSVAHGSNRFVAVSSTSGTTAAVSIDKGLTWAASTLPATAQWNHIEYGQGTFVAVSNNGTSYATSTDGIVWTARTHSVSSGLVATAFGNPNQVGSFVGAQSGAGGNEASQIKAGTTAQGRAFVASEKIFAIRIIEPGSGYTTAPTLTLTDPNNTFEAPTQVRIGKGAIGQPSFINRGTGYVSASADLLDGDGFADLFQSGSFIAVRRLSKVPALGSNVVFGHLPDRTFKLVQVLTLLGEFDGSQTAFLQVAPDVTVFDSPADETTVTTRIRYSQVRLTGHDFLDIGTGSFTETNYPGTPTQPPVQSQETRDNNGGRVFFTSTDQDGNFRVGDLFTIEQSTGIATLNADAFNISGLQELTLGEVTLGGNSASITEFSTDPFFSANSDSIVPTQRAIKAYISSQIGGGGASLNVNSVTAGFITIQNNTITTTTGSIIEMKAKFNFRSGVVGLPIAFNFFLT
jgi:hypothetical protein